MYSFHQEELKESDIYRYRIFDHKQLKMIDI